MPQTKPLIYVSAGSNLGDRCKNLEQARQFLENETDRVFRVSSCYETKPVGGPLQGDYLNEVWELDSDLSPQELLEKMLKVEARLGRIRLEKNGPRTIDLDILFFGAEKIQAPGLQIPHPRLHERAFVLKPLLDLCPEFIHPVRQKNIKTLWRELPDSSGVSLYENH